VDIATIETNIGQISAALAMLAAGTPAHTALTEALDAENGKLALAQAEIELQATKQAELDAASAALVGIGDATLRDTLLASARAAIEAKYAPAAPAVEPTPAASNGRKQVGAVSAARNAAVAADPASLARGKSYLTPFDATDAALVVGVSRAAGTRYPGMVALASNGPGVANRGDYMDASAAVRLYMRVELGYSADGGNGYCDNNWLLAAGRHAPSGDKGDDSFPRKFQRPMRLALYPDGMFRMAGSNTAGVRFVDSDAQAWQKWSGSHSATPAAPAANVEPTTERKAPTPPNAMANPYGSITPTTVCKHCNRRTLAKQPTCGHCKGIAYES
jgi:hypothetical protein